MATRNIVPRADGEGGIGTSLKKWLYGFFHNLTVAGTITGDLTGNVTGNVTGDLTGNVTGNVTGDLTGTASGNLPLAGGTITGSIIAGTNVAITNSIDNLYTQINGGTEQSKGAWLRLNGKDNVGTFQIRANNGTTDVSLVGNPDGTFTWDGKSVERINDKAAINAANNYIRFESGLQICWTTAQMTNSGYTWTYAKAFTSSNPVVQVTTNYSGSFSGTNAQRMISWVGDVSTTSCKVYSNTDATSNIYKSVIAIGRWK